MNAGHADARTRVGLGLHLAVHWDAFRASPGAYVVAAWWRLRGKRLRARGQFATLLGRSPRAYDLWMLWHEKPAPVQDAAGAPILALIDARNARAGQLDDSLRTLMAAGIAALPVGTADGPTLADALDRIDWAARPWLMPILAGDRVAPGAGALYRAAIAETPARIAYADDDLLERSGSGKVSRTKPHFKPDWNSELFRHHDYLTGACILRPSREEMLAIADAPDWACRITALKAGWGAGEGAPLHIPHVLHHRATRPAPQVPSAPVDRARDLPSVTIIVPTRNRMELLCTCLDGIAATHYPQVEVIVVDNDSDDPATLDYLASLDPARYRVLRHAGPFNYSAINNRAAEVASGQLLCLLNNDIEVIEPDWLATMAVQAVREDVGAVGARLLYPDGRIQHAGVVIGMGNAAGHAHRFLRADEEGYFHRHALPQFVSAVTAACLLVQRDRFLAVGRLDETRFTVAFNDVDLCLRLNQRGWQSLYEPRATLIHHESVSRGLDQDPLGAARLAGELAVLRERWRTDAIVDPFHHPHLSRSGEQFAVML